jgi:hypothetical protein
MPFLSTYPLPVNMSAVNVIAIVTRYLSFAADFIIIIIWYHVSRKITSEIINLFVITSSQSSPCLVHQSTPSLLGCQGTTGTGTRLATLLATSLDQRRLVVLGHIPH